MPLKKQQGKYKVWEETSLLGLLAMIKWRRIGSTEEVVSSKRRAGVSPVFKV